MRKLMLLFCLLTALLLSGCSENAALGVIGGADGPTVIVVSGPDDLLPAE